MFIIPDDGGYTWVPERFHLSKMEYGVIPVASLIQLDNLLFFSSCISTTGNWIDRIVCQKSTDGGITWNDGSYMGLNGTKAQDKEWAVVDWTNNTMYVTWTQFDDYGSSNPNDKSIIEFSKSTDAGETWSPALKINEVDGDCIDSDNTDEGAVPAVGPNGEIYVGWVGPVGLVFDRSLDGGQTWLDNDIFVSDVPGGWDYNIPGISRCNGLPITVCDLSEGPYRGNIYINWTDQRNGQEDTDVWMVKSTDGGNTWSEPKRVNDDPPGKQQFFSWMAIDQATGYLWFVWYDRRNYSDDNTDVYMAASIDGGETFINFKVSEEPFLPWSNVFFGDYTNVSAHNNVIRPIWARLENGQLSILTAIVNPDAVISTGITEPDRVPFATLGPNYPNPFMQSTYISFELEKSEIVTLKVYDMFGRTIATLIDHEARNRGEFVEHFDATPYNLNAGVYYFSLTGEGLNLQRKIMLVK